MKRESYIITSLYLIKFILHYQYISWKFDKTSAGILDYHSYMSRAGTAYHVDTIINSTQQWDSSQIYPTNQLDLPRTEDMSKKQNRYCDAKQ